MEISSRVLRQPNTTLVATISEAPEQPSPTSDATLPSRTITAIVAAPSQAVVSQVMPFDTYQFTTDQPSISAQVDGQVVTLQYAIASPQ